MPDFDDTGWQRVDSVLRPKDIDWTGIGWFRLRLRLDPTLEVNSLVCSLHQGGASEVYLDGERTGGWGTVGTSPDSEESFWTFTHFQPLSLTAGREHIVAVRYSNWQRHDRTGSGPGFRFRLGELDTASASRDRRILALSTEASFVAGAATAFSVLHLLLFVFFPRSRANLAYALFTATIAGIYVADSQAMFAAEPAVSIWWLRWLGILGTFLPVFGLLFATLSFRSRIPRYVAALVLMASASAIWIGLQPGVPNLVPVMIFSALVFLDMLRVVVLALLRRSPDVWLMALGLSIYVVIAIAAPFFLLQGYRFAMSIAMIGLITSVSAYLAKGVARTRREAQQHAVEHELLAAENRRQAEELEAARALQLSLLPAERPDLNGFDIAFEMRTATEVGGDYYDYKAASGGRLVIALGDATGHGLDAGLMVVAAKSLFQSGEDDLPPGQLLSRLSLGVRRLGLRRMRMSMLVIQIAGSRIRCAAAGMPPPLCYCAATGSVEEMEVSGPPLGALVGFAYGEHERALAPGDTALLLTDGLPELADAAGELLGYNRTRKMFAEAVANATSAQQIVGNLFAAGERFAAGRALGDDMTLAVLRVL